MQKKQPGDFIEFDDYYYKLKDRGYDVGTESVYGDEVTSIDWITVNGKNHVLVENFDGNEMVKDVGVSLSELKKGKKKEDLEKMK